MRWTVNLLASANRQRGARLIAALLVLVAIALAGILPAAAQRPNGAGLVIRFGDGSIIYAYVQFEEESITSEELLYRSGLAVAIAPYSGLGAGVCMIDGEGCPSDDCFCQSYTTPAYFWHFYANDGGWRELLQGASSRSIGDGDIDGWSWTAGESGLPAVTIDEIALMNGVDRNPPPPTETPTPEPTNTLPPTDTPQPTAAQQPTDTPTSTPAPADEAAATGTASATATTAASATATPTPLSNQDGARATNTRVASPTATSTRTPTAPPPPTLTLVASATTVAVLVQPDGTTVPVEVVQADDGSSATNLLLFGGLVAVAGGAGAFVWLRGRRA
jgi:hypothetical protein